ncbi:MAG: D-2-hydroxyacid dehydrogenase family protein [Proteobacteria bacterium]|nr:D-2-hydroxyacid dehydrogenase family protein [Burkholderiales bacterium]
MNIAVLDDFLGVVPSLAAFARIADRSVTVFRDPLTDVDALADRLAPFDALVLSRERTPITARLLDRLPNLRIVSQTGVIPHIDVAACTARGVVVCTSRTGPSYTTAELTWALILASMRFIPQEAAALREGRWQTRFGRGLRGLTLGVFGYGWIGALVASYGRAFDMRVLVWGRAGSIERAHDDGYRTAESAQAFFAEADIVTVHLRMLPETRGIVSAADLARMKPDSLFVNTSRAALVENGALLAALQAGRPGYAALDVFDEEPVTGAHDPLVTMDNVICSPHVGYVTRDRFETMFESAFDQILAFERGAPINVVNPEVLRTGQRD